MSKLEFCKYCNEMVMAEYPQGATKEEKEKIAIDCCTCDEAQAEKERLQEIIRAKGRVEELFGEYSSEIGFEPLSSEGLMRLMYETVELVSSETIRAATINITNKTTAKISMTKKKINVERTQVKKYKL